MDRRPGGESFPILGALLFYGALGGGALLWIHLRGRWEPFHQRMEGSWSLWASVGSGVLLALLVFGGSAFFSRRSALFHRLETEMREILGPMSESQVIVLALASGVAEELFFRGAMQDALGLWATSVLFALLHVGRGRHFLVWTASCFVLGLVLGAMVEAGSGLLPVTLAHVLINYLNLRRLCVEPSA